ncbi:hypothetical protein JXJ21_24710 [candidate division KSB1 bacterium]|nr:hypothetical protein [candidate division KSB1 bacterium]
MDQQNETNRLSAMKNYIRIPFLVSWTFLAFLLLNCTQKNESLESDQVVARVGDKAITRQEFIRRSEYAIRPPYCRENNYIHKKIVLNSLIGEKLLAMEAGEDNKLARNPDFQAYLEGRKEQAMRQVHYHQQAYNKVELSPDEIKKEFDAAGRTYRVSYFTVPNNDLSLKIAEKFKSENISFEDMYQSLAGDTAVPQRKIAWISPEIKQIKEPLFKQVPRKGQILGPIQIDDGNCLFMKVNGWIDARLITENDIRNRRQQVVDQLKNEKAWADYKSYVGKLMQKKQMQFSEDTFRKLVTIVAPIYLNAEQTKKQMFNNSFWQNKEAESDGTNLPQSLDALDQLPFFTVDGTVWTVKQFRAYLKRHPLVFRKEGAKSKPFAEQFKLAVADLVRDYYITQDAYKKDYDENPAVRQQVDMWRDHLLALYQKYKYLDSKHVSEKDQMKIINDHLAAYIDSLQVRYGAHIQINLAAFDKIQLTRIDMVALQPDQPFQIVVPSFPLITTDHRLDYGKVMQ